MASLPERLAGAWAQIISVALGWWLMAAPAVLGYAGLAADAHRILGPIASAFALIAVWGHVRPLRWANVPLGGLVAAVPLLAVTPYASPFTLAATVNRVLAGVALVALSFVRGEVYGEFGGGWSSLWTGDVVGESESGSRP